MMRIGVGTRWMGPDRMIGWAVALVAAVAGGPPAGRAEP